MQWQDLNPGYHIDVLSDSVGIPSGILKQVVCLLISFPFSFILKRLPDHNIGLKNGYIIGVSALYLFAILNIFGGFVTLMISSLGCYLITRYVHNPWMPWINFVFCMGHLAFSHLKAQFFIDSLYDPNVIDITGAQMVLVMKLTSFGWSVQDGRNPPDEELTPHQKSKVIEKHPNIITFMSFTFFFPSLLTGPSFDFADYDRYIIGHLFSDVPESKRPGKHRKRLIPKNGTTVSWKLVQGFFWAFLFFKSGDYLSSDTLFSDSYKKLWFPAKVILLYFTGLTYRFKYYAAWTISEAACILCGLGYNGYDKETGKFKWNAVQNVDPIAFETGQNAHVCLEAWNMNTNKWLKNFVYLRVKRKNHKPGFKSTMFTFVVSAFWHGTQPGYYLSFIAGALYQSSMKIYRRNIRPIFLGNPQAKLFYDIVTFFVTQLSFGFVVQPFVILEFHKSIQCWASVYFYPLVGVFVTLYLFRGPQSTSVVNFLKKYHATMVTEEKPMAKEPIHAKSATTSSNIKNPKLAQILKDKEEFEEFGVLAVPNPDISKEEFERNMKEAKEFGEEIKNWSQPKQRRQSFSEGHDILKGAINEFTKEVTSLIPNKDKTTKNE